jgi:hypothetical protein
MFQPALSRDAERAVFVNPALPLEAGAIRSPDVAASNLFVGQVLRPCVLHQPIDAGSTLLFVLPELQALTVAAKSSTAKQTRTFELYDPDALCARQGTFANAGPG